MHSFEHCTTCNKISEFNSLEVCIECGNKLENTNENLGNHWATQSEAMYNASTNHLDHIDY